MCGWDWELEILLCGAPCYCLSTLFCCCPQCQASRSHSTVRSTQRQHWAGLRTGNLELGGSACWLRIGNQKKTNGGWAQCLDFKYRPIILAYDPRFQGRTVLHLQMLGTCTAHRFVRRQRVQSACRNSPCTGRLVRASYAWK